MLCVDPETTCSQPLDEIVDLFTGSWARQKDGSGVLWVCTDARAEIVWLTKNMFLCAYRGDPARPPSTIADDQYIDPIPMPDMNQPESDETKKNLEFRANYGLTGPWPGRRGRYMCLVDTNEIYRHFPLMGHFQRRDQPPNVPDRPMDKISTTDGALLITNQRFLAKNDWLFNGSSRTHYGGK